MIKNQSGQHIGAQMTSAVDGSDFTGTVTVYVTIDAGVQVIGSVGSGLCTAEGNGYYSYAPSAAETNGDLLAFTFTGSGAITATVQVATESALAHATTGGAGSPRAITAADLCFNIAVRLGVAQAGEVLAPEDQQVILDTLNTYVDGLATESLTMYDVSRTTWTITDGTDAYTIGASGDIVSPRPVSPQSIDRITFLDPAVSTTYEMRLTPISTQAWQSVADKTQAGAYPTGWYYNATYGPSAEGTLYLWPVPNQTLTGVLYLAQPVAQMALGTVISLPPGYRRFLETNVAIEVAPAFTVEPSAILIKAAVESRANIKRVNTRLSDLTIDPALTGRGMYSIWTDN